MFNKLHPSNKKFPVRQVFQIWILLWLFCQLVEISPIERRYHLFKQWSCKIVVAMKPLIDHIAPSPVVEDKEKSEGSKFTTTWRPANDYVNLKVSLLQMYRNVTGSPPGQLHGHCRGTSGMYDLVDLVSWTCDLAPSWAQLSVSYFIQVNGSSFLLWVSENYKDFCKEAEELTSKEVKQWK